MAARQPAHPGWARGGRRLFCMAVPHGGHVGVHSVRRLASPAVGSAHFLFVVGACVALFVTWAFSNELSSYRLVHYALAVACTLTGCVGLWILREQDAFLWAPALLSGCGFGFLYTLYGEYVCLFFYGSVKPYIHGIFACATIACAGLLFAGREMSFFFALLFPLVALVAYALQLCFFRLQDRPPVDRKVSDGRHRVVWRSYLATATSGCGGALPWGALLLHADRAIVGVRGSGRRWWPPRACSCCSIP